MEIADYKIVIKWHCPNCDTYHEDEVEAAMIEQLDTAQFECFETAVGGCGQTFYFDTRSEHAISKSHSRGPDQKQPED